MRWRLLGFAVAAAYWPGMLSGVFVPRWSVIAIGVPLVSRVDPRNTGPVAYLLLWCVALGAVSLIAAPDRLAGIEELFFIFLLCVTFIAASELGSLDDAMTGLGYGLGVSSVLCIPQLFGWNGVSESASPAGLFFNREVLAEFAAPILVWALLRPRWVIAAFALVPILLCNSRIAVVVLCLGLLYAWKAPRWIKPLLICGLVIASVAAIWYLGPGKLASAQHRIVLWGAAVLSITPLGHGLGWFQAAHRGEETAHSDALQALVELGWGAGALVFIPILAFWRKRGNLAERGAFVAICAEIVLSFPLHLPATGFLAAILAGFLAGDRNPLRLGRYDGRVEDGSGLQWTATAHRAAFGGGR